MSRLVASPCLWGKLQNLSFPKVSKQGVMSFCVAGAAPDILTAGALRRFQKISCIFRGRCNTLETSIVILRGSPVRNAILRANRNIWDTLHFSLWTLHSTLYTLHFCTPHFAPYTLQFTLHTLHPTRYTPHFTLYTLHSTRYTPQSTLYTFIVTLHTVHFTPHSLHSTL